MMMKKWSIENRVSGVELGVYEGETREAALDAMARDAGYRDYAEACEVSAGELTVTPATDIELIIERFNEGAYGYRIIDAGAGWDSKYLWEDRDSSLCSPAPTKDIRATAAQLGITA